MATRVNASKLGKIKDPKAEGFKATASKPETAKDESWKDEIRGYYQNSADQSVKSSNEQYDRAISQSNNAALARGMGRSSYALATGAGLENKKAEAANQIRTNAENEANMAILNQQNVRDQMDFQKEQAAQQQQNWQAQFDNTVQQQQQAQANWQAQFDANQQQQAWQNQFQQNQWNWQVSQANAAAASSGGGRGGYTSNPGSTSNPDTGTKSWYELLFGDTSAKQEANPVASVANRIGNAALNTFGGFSGLDTETYRKTGKKVYG